MFQKLRNKLKEQQGMTLIELLAVIVILAIISAIAIPSIMGLIDNSRKDSVVANAQQMINSTKLAVSGDDSLRPASTSASDAVYVTLKYLEDKGFVETIKDPDGGAAYSSQANSGTSTASTTQPTEANASYVKVTMLDSTGKLQYSVFLKGSKKYIGALNGPKLESELKRSVVSP